MENIKSVLVLENLYFDKISFERKGVKNQKDISFELNVDIEERINRNDGKKYYLVKLTANGNKEDEYDLVVSVVGIFSINQAVELSEEIKKNLIYRNTVAILMPYVRSQVSLITAQPEVECVVLPPFNINNMIN